MLSIDSYLTRSIISYGSKLSYLLTYEGEIPDKTNALSRAFHSNSTVLTAKEVLKRCTKVAESCEG